MSEIINYPNEITCPDCGKVNVVELYVGIVHDFICVSCGTNDYELDPGDATIEQAARQRRIMEQKYPLYDWNLSAPAPVKPMCIRIKFPVRLS